MAFAPHTCFTSRRDSTFHPATCSPLLSKQVRSRQARPLTVASLINADASKKQSVLIFGGGSALGQSVVSHFTQAKWRVYTLDYYDASVECGGVNGCAIPLNTDVPISLALPSGAPARTQVDVAHKCLLSSCADKFDVIINATLGFMTASLEDDNVFETMDYMYRTSVESSLITAKLASSFMSPGGLLSFLGSVAALPGTNAPKMLGFGMAKASVHQMVRLLAGSVGTDLPSDSSVVAIVPEVLDTPVHRAMNFGESGENWTPCDVMASKLVEWAQQNDRRPPNGSLISVSSSKSVSDEINISTAGSDGMVHKFRLLQDESYVQSASL